MQRRLQNRIERTWSPASTLAQSCKSTRGKQLATLRQAACHTQARRLSTNAQRDRKAHMGASSCAPHRMPRSTCTQCRIVLLQLASPVTQRVPGTWLVEADGLCRRVLRAACTSSFVILLPSSSCISSLISTWWLLLCVWLMATINFLPLP